MIAVLVLISLYPLLDERSSTPATATRQTRNRASGQRGCCRCFRCFAISIMATGILSSNKAPCRSILCVADSNDLA